MHNVPKVNSPALGKIARSHARQGAFRLLNSWTNYTIAVSYIILIFGKTYAKAEEKQEINASTLLLFIKELPYFLTSNI